MLFNFKLHSIEDNLHLLVNIPNKNDKNKITINRSIKFVRILYTKIKLIIIKHIINIYDISLTEIK